MNGEPISQILNQYAKRDDLTIEELMEVSHALLQRIAPQQTRYKVTDRPDIRTIRYYISQSLLPKPVSYQGGKARYAFGHLVRLLLIKKMQAEHHTLKKIGQALKSNTDDEIVFSLTGRSLFGAEFHSPQATSAVVKRNVHLPDAILFQQMAVMPGIHLVVPDGYLKDRENCVALSKALADLSKAILESTLIREKKNE